MDHETMKLECLKTVLEKWPGLSPDEARREAMRMYNFIRGRELDDAGGESVTYRAPGRIETPKATIHREPPFGDYKPE